MKKLERMIKIYGASVNLFNEDKGIYEASFESKENYEECKSEILDNTFDYGIRVSSFASCENKIYFRTK